MKKIIYMGLLVCLFFSCTALAANIIVEQNKTIKIGTEEVKFTNDLYKIDDKIYVPIRELSEKLNIPVNWNEEKGRVELSINNKHVRTEKAQNQKRMG